MTIKITYLIFAALFLTACGSDQQAVGSASDSTPVAKPVGQFRATLGDKSYDLETQCLNLEKEFFAFSSDSKDSAAYQGNRVVISGMQSLSNLMLKIMDDGETWSARNITSWEKSASGAVGSGQMVKAGDSSSYEITFEVICK